eukprot:8604822-Pyramimonas_sp.AAC.1
MSLVVRIQNGAARPNRLCFVPQPTVCRWRLLCSAYRAQVAPALFSLPCAGGSCIFSSDHDEIMSSSQTK